MTGAAIRTIAVHLPTAALCERLLDVAIPLARAHQATITGVHVVPAVVVYADATVSMSTEFIVAQQEAFADDAKLVETTFRTKLAAAGIDHVWSTAGTEDEPTMRAAASLCNSADLVIAAQYDSTIPAAAGYIPDELVLGTGRPVLIVPLTGQIRPIGRRVLVAWNGSREASRASFDCLSLVTPEAEVRLVAVDSPRGNATMEAVIRSLKMHSVNVHGSIAARRNGRSVGEEILQLGTEFDADLVVLGCYGHSRLMETIFGGATTRVLRDMTLPVLMAH